MDSTSLARAIDQTLLRPTAGLAGAAEWMEQSAGTGFATLCVAPFMVPLAAQRLVGTTTAVCSVVGFPLGYSLTETKVEETVHLLQLGCGEIDMVMNVGAFLEGELQLVRDDIEAVVTAVRDFGAGIVKVILETGHLDDAGIAQACEVAAEAGADFVKTSTGFGPRGASVRDVEIMRATVGTDLGVKAAGGIRDFEAALKMIEAGANRVGTSAGLEILTQAAARGL